MRRDYGGGASNSPVDRVVNIQNVSSPPIRRGRWRVSRCGRISAIDKFCPKKLRKLERSVRDLDDRHGPHTVAEGEPLEWEAAMRLQHVLEALLKLTLFALAAYSRGTRRDVPRWCVRRECVMDEAERGSRKDLEISVRRVLKIGERVESTAPLGVERHAAMLA